jgi:hypothetical protein
MWSDGVWTAHKTTLENEIKAIDDAMGTLPEKIA